MGIFDSISSRQKKELSPAGSRNSGAVSKNTATQQSKAGDQVSQMKDIQAERPLSIAARAAYTPSASIPNAQAFVTSDTPFNAGSANYVQSVMKKKQMSDANKAEALDQAAKTQAMMRKQAQANSVQPRGGWPSLPPYLDIAGRDLKDPSYQAMLSHLGVTRGFLLVLDEDFDQILNTLVKAHKVERRHIDRAGREACELANKYLAEKWSVYVSVHFVWDATINEGAFRFTYPLSKDQRFKWSEQVKGPRWSDDDWADWNDGKKSLGIS